MTWPCSHARQLTEWHSQWLVVNDYLRTVTVRGAVGDVLEREDPRFGARDGEVSAAGGLGGGIPVRPEHGASLPDGRAITSISDMLRFAGVMS